MKAYDDYTFFRLGAIFTVSFVLNFIWEHLHSVLYAHYQGGMITYTILFKATLGDALFITALSILFFRISYLKSRVWLAIPIAILCAIALELFALSTGRWAYNDLMPLIPYLDTGLTPTVQLGLLGYVSIVTVQFWQKKNATK